MALDLWDICILTRGLSTCSLVLFTGSYVIKHVRNKSSLQQTKHLTPLCDALYNKTNLNNMYTLWIWLSSGLLRRVGRSSWWWRQEVPLKRRKKFYQTTRRNNPEDSHLHTRHHETLKSRCTDFISTSSGSHHSTDIHLEWDLMFQGDEDDDVLLGFGAL
jgi:hypothetical protein